MPMRISGVVAMLAMAGTGAWGRLPEPSRQLTLCMENLTGSAVQIVQEARSIASGIFAAIGVKIRWQGPFNCPSEAIYLSWSRESSATVLPGALAYAMPYEGRHIIVFLDRVKDMAPFASGRLLGYTLAHEITHILEGVVRHSDSGIMKARWELHDRYLMRQGRLGFAAEDVNLLYRGLDERQSGLAGLAASASDPRKE